MPDATKVNQWIPVVSSAIVGIFTILGIGVTQIFTVRRDRQLRILEVETQRINQRKDFQRKTLLDLQRAIQRYARAVGAAHHHDVMTARRIGTWGYLLSEELNQATFNTNVQLSVLATRVLDPELRSLISQFQTMATSILISTSESASEIAMRAWVQHSQDVNDRLGHILRNLL